jgi:peptide/nickel transport system ATP-binding protein/oligopeptide transport system ATP-binding protein
MTVPVASARPAGAPAAPALVEVEHLVKHFPVKGGILQRTIGQVKAVDDVSFVIRRGETLGLVGESGCGKTTVGRLILRLIEPTSGIIRIAGDSGTMTDLAGLGSAALKPFRRRMQIIFQDPFASLDPRSPIGDSIAEGLRIHASRENGWHDGSVRREKTLRMMDMVGLAPYHARRYPHEFSGGQRQRIGIARALILEPDLVVCDEPVSALDVSIQAQVLNLLKQLQRELGLTYLFIAHNMGVVEHLSDRVAVMYLGKVAELATRDRMFTSPQHPYTQALFSAIPVPDPELPRRRIILQGDVPSPLNPPTGCRFNPRCHVRAELGGPAICAESEPALREVADGQFAACHFRDGSEHAMVREPRDAPGVPFEPATPGR